MKEKIKCLLKLIGWGYLGLIFIKILLWGFLCAVPINGKIYYYYSKIKDVEITDNAKIRKNIYPGINVMRYFVTPWQFRPHKSTVGNIQLYNNIILLYQQHQAEKQNKFMKRMFELKNE